MDQTVPHANAIQKIQELFDLGGVIAGGAVVSHLLGYEETRDLDFFFNSLNNYNKARNYLSYNLDIVYYNTPNPYDSFDLTIAQCSLNSQGEVSMSDACAKALEDKTIRVVRENLFMPYSTIRRIQRYSTKYGFTVDSSDYDYVMSLIKLKKT